MEHSNDDQAANSGLMTTGSIEQALVELQNTMDAASTGEGEEPTRNSMPAATSSEEAAATDQPGEKGTLYHLPWYACANSDATAKDVTRVKTVNLTNDILRQLGDQEMSSAVVMTISQAWNLVTKADIIKVADLFGVPPPVRKQANKQDWIDLLVPRRVPLMTPGEIASAIEAREAGKLVAGGALRRGVPTQRPSPPPPTGEGPIGGKRKAGEVDGQAAPLDLTPTVQGDAAAISTAVTNQLRAEIQQLVRQEFSSMTAAGRSETPNPLQPPPAKRQDRKSGDEREGTEKRVGMKERALWEKRQEIIELVGLRQDQHKDMNTTEQGYKLFAALRDKCDSILLNDTLPEMIAARRRNQDASVGYTDNMYRTPFWVMNEAFPPDIRMALAIYAAPEEIKRVEQVFGPASTPGRRPALTR